MGELRPVEKLCLMGLAGEEKVTPKNELAAILAYLCYCEYVVIEADSLRLTPSGERTITSRMARASGILRTYEIAILENVGRYDFMNLMSTMFAGDFGEELISQGLWRIEKTKGRIFDRRTVVQTEIALPILDKMKEVRTTIEKAIASGRPLSPRELMDAYAFPSVILCGDLEKDAQRIFGSACRGQQANNLFLIATITEVIQEMATNQLLAQIQANQNTQLGVS